MHSLVLILCAKLTQKDISKTVEASIGCKSALHPLAAKVQFVVPGRARQGRVGHTKLCWRVDMYFSVTPAASGILRMSFYARQWQPLSGC